MQEINFKIVKKWGSPLIQFAAAVLLGWLGMAICKAMHLQSGAEYFAAFIAIVLFCISNVIVSLAYESFLRYTVPCWYLYILLVIVLFLSAKFLSGISIWTLYEYRMMLISISLFYLLASTMVRGIRLIYEAAESGF